MLVIIRGAGDIATGIAMRLKRARMSVVMTDIPAPTAIRRTVAFSQAIVLGETRVEDITARRADTPAEALALLKEGVVPVLPDPDGACIPVLRAEGLHDKIYVNQVETLWELASARTLAALLDCPVLAGSLQRKEYFPCW